MADYINIYGQDILAVASDPANPTLGQIWYNTTSNTLKGGGVSTSGSWATGNNMNTARYGVGAAGTQTAAVGFGGSIPGVGDTNITEEYDGTNWTTVPPGLNTARGGIAGAGTQTAGLAFGGQSTVYLGATEEYNGSTWATSPGSLNTVRSALGGAGTQTAALAFGGKNGPGASNTGATEEYDGTSWTSNPTGLTHQEGNYQVADFKLLL
jgi:hypothetical protein